MSVDSALLLLALLSFAALIVMWVAAPLHSSEPRFETVTEPAGTTVAA
jgi:hypothetical protein